MTRMTPSPPMSAVCSSTVAVSTVSGVEGSKERPSWKMPVSRRVM
ncbi:hypothetical protein [Nocardiopsis sp. CNR-923]